MNDMRSVIVPKSDQLNADDLIGGPITITITEVVIKPGDQPVSIFFEGDRGKPYKCCKSMAKVMVACWGPDANAYVGRSMTLYRDPKVKWGGMEVGGIRISHMTDLPKGKHTMALTETKGSKKLFTVMPLVEGERQASPEPAVSVPVSVLPVADIDPAATYTTKFKARLTNCPTVEAYNDIMGSETVGKNLAGLKANRPELYAEIEVVREETLKRLTGAPPMPEPGPSIEDDEVTF